MARTVPRGARRTASLAVASVALLPSIAPAAEPPSLTVSPALAEGIAHAGVRAGPFGIRNFTRQDYDLRVFPVLLGQARDGGLFVRLDRESLATARSLMSVTRRAARFPPGASVAASALVRRIPAGHSLYAGVLFQATPRFRRGRVRPQIRAVLRLDARLLLNPPARLRRVRFVAGPLRAEQAGARRLALRVPVRNAGNAFSTISGRVNVVDAGGRVVTQVALRGIRVLPGATVELVHILHRPLPAGPYRLSASLRVGRRRERALGAMRLVGVSEVLARAARLIEFTPPQAYKGHRATVAARFRNTGNIAFAPRAEVRARALAGGAAPRTTPAIAERVQAGRAGAVRASVDVPSGGEPFELTVRLLEGGRVLDARTVSVTPSAKPSIVRRASDYVTEHAVALLAIALALLVCGAVGALAYVRRLRAALGRGRGDPGS